MKPNLPFTSRLSQKTMFLVILLVTSAVLIPLGLNQNQIATAEQQQPSAGTSFMIDNTTFSHHMASVNGIQLHYVIGGHGDPVVLIHGWPETWYSWHKVMPALASNHTVIAPDLPGLGDSTKPSSSTGYDGRAVADDIHKLVADQLGFKRVFLVGHDIGAQVAYSYAAAHPSEVSKLVVMEYSGLLLGGRTLWWAAFHQAPDIPEVLTQGKEKEYLSWFYHNLAYNPSAITQTDINEYVSHYSAPGGMHAGFEYYRAIPQNMMQNENNSRTGKLAMPVLAMAASYIPYFGGNVTANIVMKQMQTLAQNVQGIQVPNSGHFVPEEQPGVVAKSLDNFFAANSTKVGK